MCNNTYSLFSSDIKVAAYISRKMFWRGKHIYGAITPINKFSPNNNIFSVLQVKFLDFTLLEIAIFTCRLFNCLIWKRLKP